MHGEGEFSWQNGMKFKGTYVHGKRNGQGIFSWPDGKRCEGTWKDGEKKDVKFFGGDGKNEIIPLENKDRLSFDTNRKSSFHN